MSGQLSIDFGARRRDVGIESALGHWSVIAIRSAIRSITVGDTFTAETVVERLTPAVRDSLRAFPNALGACFRAAALADEIEDSGGVVQAKHPDARKRRIIVWRRKA